MIITIPRTTAISTMDLRSKPGEYLDRVDYRKETFVIERDGKPKAVLVPVDTYQNLQRERAASKKRLFAMIDNIREQNKETDPQEVENEVTKAIEEYRRTKRVQPKQ